MRTIQTTLYKFGELAPDVQAAVIAAYRETIVFDETYVIDDAKEIAALMGIDIDRIYYRGFYSQGDGACFEGRYAYKAGSLTAIRSHAPTDATLHDIARRLQQVQKSAFYRLCATVRQKGFYMHEGCTSIDVWHDLPSWGGGEERDAFPAQHDAIASALRDFMRWVYKQLQKEHEYQRSDEAIAETLRRQGYEFTESGQLINNH